jgi:phenylacetate-CoA ligase
VSIALKIYDSLPIALQNQACSIEGWRNDRRRYGGDFHSILNQIITMGDLDTKNLSEEQTKCLSSFMKAALTSHYWSRQFKEFNVNIDSGDLFTEIKKLPVLTKDVVKRYSSEIRTRIIPESQVISSRTSGSTG